MMYNQTGRNLAHDMQRVADIDISLLLLFFLYFSHYLSSACAVPFQVDDLLQNRRRHQIGGRQFVG